MGQGAGKGTGGTTASLIAWLGPDPVATLQSICTHQPKRAYVLYDQDEQRSRTLASRLLEPSLTKQLPVDTLVVLPSDKFAVDVTTQLRSALRERPLRFDITPARMSQKIPILRKLEKSDLWEQRGDLARCRRLDNCSASDLVMPPLDLVVRVGGLDPRPVVKDADGFAALARLVREHLDEQAAGTPVLNELPEFSCALGRVRHRGDGIVVSEHRGVNRPVNAVRRNNQWFEDLVANQLLAARAVNVHTTPYGWEQDDQVDVVARFQHSGDLTFLCAVSCKVGKNENPVAEAIRHRGVADRFTGRLSVAVLAWPYKYPRGPMLLDTWGVLHADMTLLSDPTALRDALCAAWKKRSTLL